MADFSYSHDHKLQDLGARVANNPEDTDAWQELLEAVLRQDGRLSRNANPSAIAAARETFNRFLALYPLSQDTWCKYADVEFRLAGTEAAEYIYERAVGSCPTSIEIWRKYCEHKTTTTQNVSIIRETFERAIENVGYDFYSDPVWDAYLLSDTVNTFDILKRVIKIPLFHYAKYYERFRQVASQQPIELVASSSEALEQAQLTAQKELGDGTQRDLANSIRAKVDMTYWESFQKLQENVNQRWNWEQHIGKDGGAAVEDSDQKWREYLDYEERRGDYKATRTLYERCLTFNSSQVEFWFRYIRWMSTHDDAAHLEETRSIYRRACCVFAPIYDSAIRYSWARFEEAYGRPSVAIDIYEGVLLQLPHDIQIHRSLTQVYRRQHGLDGALQSLQSRIGEAESLSTRGTLVVEWANLVWHETGDAQAAREVLKSQQGTLTDCATFWAGWMTFEIEQPRGGKDSAKDVYQSMQQLANLPAHESRHLSALYMRYLEECGTAADMLEVVEIDALVHGPDVMRSVDQVAKRAVNGK